MSANNSRGMLTTLKRFMDSNPKLAKFSFIVPIIAIVGGLLNSCQNSKQSNQVNKTATSHSATTKADSSANSANTKSTWNVDKEAKLENRDRVSLLKIYSSLTAGTKPAADFTQTLVQCKVTKIYDGDTIHCLRQTDKEVIKIRFLGIDAPEASQIYGKGSTKNLAALLNDRQYANSLYIQQHDVDQYQRVLATLYLKDFNNGSIQASYLNLNAYQVATGSAVTYIGSKNRMEKTYLSRLYCPLLINAEKQQLGLWNKKLWPNGKIVLPSVYRKQSKEAAGENVGQDSATQESIAVKYLQCNGAY